MNLNYKLSELLGNSMIDLRNNKIFLEYFENIETESINDDYYLTNEKKGIGIVFNSNKILENIHLYSGNKDGINKFSSSLPAGLHFRDNIKVVENKIELKRFESGGGEILPIIGKTNYWRKYHYDNCYLHIETNNKNTLELITIGKNY